MAWLDGLNDWSSGGASAASKNTNGKGLQYNGILAHVPQHKRKLCSDILAKSYLHIVLDSRWVSHIHLWVNLGVLDW